MKAGKGRCCADFHLTGWALSDSKYWGARVFLMEEHTGASYSNDWFLLLTETCEEEDLTRTTHKRCNEEYQLADTECLIGY